MPVSTGSDTRMYSPRSESNLGYTKDPEDNPHGIGDPETMEQERDKRMLEQEHQQTISDLPHLQLDVPNPNPTPPPPPEMPEEPAMDDDNENARGAEVSQLTGMPDTGNLSIGNATGTMPQPGGMLATGEPMNLAWRLLKQPDQPLQAPTEEVPSNALGIIGHRDFNDSERFNHKIGEWINTGGMPTHIVTDSGAGAGVLAQAWAAENDIPITATNTPNDLIDGSDHILAFPSMHGQATMGKVTLARRKGKPVHMHYIEHPHDAPLVEVGAGKKRERNPSPWLNEPEPERTSSEPPSIEPQRRRSGPTRGHRGRRNVQKGEPMDAAWSSLLKARKNLKNMRSSSVRPWKQPQFNIQPGGADISTATSRRSKLHSRHLTPHKHRGLDRAPLSVHRSHLGIATKQPLRLFPQKYGQQMGSMQRRKWQGNIPSGHPSGHAMGPETTYSPRAPKVASSAGLNIRSPTGPKLQGQNMGIKNTMKSEDIAGIKEDLTLLRKEMNYMHFAQMRRLMRKIKEAMADKERRLKAAVSSGPGEKGKAGHMEGQDKTTRPEGATEDLKNIPESWGAPSSMFVAPGSGRVG